MGEPQRQGSFWDQWDLQGENFLTRAVVHLVGINNVCCDGKVDGSVVEQVPLESAVRSQEVSRQFHPGTPTSRGDVELQAVAREGDALLLDSLLRSGRHPDEVGEDSPRSRGATALVYAARAGHRDAVNRLLAEPTVNANVLTKDEESGTYTNFTPLLWSVVEGRLGAFMSLLRDNRVDYEVQTMSGLRALHLAVLKGSAEMVQALLDVRGDPTARVLLSSGMEVTPLLLAVAGSRPHIVQQLVGELPPAELAQPVTHLESGLTVQATEQGDLWRCTPENGLPVAVRKTPDFEGETTGLMLSPDETFRVVQQVGDPKGVLFLKLPEDKGWVFNQKPGIGRMCSQEDQAPREELWRCTPANGQPVPLRQAPEHEARKRGGELKPGETFRVTETVFRGGVKFLQVQGGGWVSDSRPGVGLLCTKGGANPVPVSVLHYAASRRNVAAAVAIMEAKADPNLPDRKGRSLIQKAIRNSCPEMVISLVQYGAETRHVFSAIRRAQLHGDAVLLDKMLKVAGITEPSQLAARKRASSAGPQGGAGAAPGWPLPVRDVRRQMPPNSPSESNSSLASNFQVALVSPVSTLATTSDLASLSPEDCRLQPDDTLPSLHKAVFRKDAATISAALQELASRGGSASTEVDGGGLHAVFYAIEMGYFDLAKQLLVQGHGFSEDLSTRILGAVKDKGPTRAKSLRIFQVACELMSNGAALGASRAEAARGAADFLSAWCGSLAAFHFFQPRLELFARFRSQCKARCKRICEELDKADHPLQRQTLENATSGLREAPCRQDDPGLLPKLRYSSGELGFDGLSRTDLDITQMLIEDHEIRTCRTLSLLAVALHAVFQADMSHVVSGVGSPTSSDASPALESLPPKSFAAVQSALLALPQLDDPTARTPRAMENVDMLRCHVVCQRAEHVADVVTSLKARYKILSAKNTHVRGTKATERAVTLHLAYDAGLNFGEVFGSSGSVVSTDKGHELRASDFQGQAWIRYVAATGEPSDWAASLLPLLQIGAERPEEAIFMVAEVKIFYSPYVRARALTELLTKVVACESGPAEMVSALYSGQFERQTPEAEAETAAREAVERIAGDARAAPAAAGWRSGPDADTN